MSDKQIEYSVFCIENVAKELEGASYKVARAFSKKK